MIKAKILRRPNIVIAGGNEAVIYRDSLTLQPTGYLNMKLYKKIATKIVLRFSTEILVVSNFMVKDVKQLSGGRLPKVVPNCVDTKLFNAGSQLREFVTTIFRLDEGPTRLKRGDIFIKAIPNILREYPLQKFLIIGYKGDAYQRLINLAKELNITHALTFVGAVKNDEIVNYLQRSKVYVQISDTETFGVAVAEAMSVQTPVIVSAKGALPEITKGIGITADHNSVDSVTLALMNILKMTEDQRSNLGIACRNVIVKNYSYDVRKKIIGNIIYKILNKSSS